MPELPTTPAAPDIAGHATVVPKPSLFYQDSGDMNPIRFSHFSVENVRYWVKTKVSPEGSLRWIGAMSLCGRFVPGLSAAIAGSSAALGGCVSYGASLG
jgi:hypothetical protein